jgi:hypothetical protein
MNSIGIQQILPGEPGYTDLGKPTSADPPRAIARCSTPAEDQATLAAIATTVEGLLKELKRKPASERVAQIDASLRAKTPALLGEVASRRRLATGAVRAYADNFVSVREARRRLLGITLAANHDELVPLVVEALELFKTECQNAPVS